MLKSSQLTGLLAFLVILHKSWQGNWLNAANLSGITPLHLAVGRSMKLAKMLIDAGADVNALDRTGATPLHHTVMYNKYDILKLLIESNATVDTINNNNETALFFTTYAAADPNITRFLIQSGADKNLVNKDGLTPIHNAIIRKNKNIFDILLEEKVNVERCDSGGNAPLHSAVSSGIYYVEGLLDNGANINPRNKFRKTPLHIATETSNKDAVDLLLRRGADVEALDNYNNTALHLALESNNFEIAELILTMATNDILKGDVAVA